MIETKIIDLIEIGDSVQKTYIYSKPFMIKFFSFFRTMLKFQQDNIFLIFVLRLYYYFQFILIPVSKIDSDDDSLFKFLKTIKKLIFIPEIVNSKKSFIIILSFIYFYCILLLSNIIYLMLNYNNLKIKQNLLKILNFLNLLLINTFLCPIINILLLTTKCTKNYHIFLNIKCYSNIGHMIIVIVSIIFLFFIIIYSILLSIYYYEIGSVKGLKCLYRINSNLEIYSNLFSILCFYYSYLLQYYFDESQFKYIIIDRAIIFINTFFFTIYSYKKVLYYDNKINNLNIISWALISWYIFCLILKKLFLFTNCILLVIIGWIIISIIVFILNASKNEFYLTEYNVLDAKNIKDIEMFTNNLLKITMDSSIKSKTLLIGLINTLNDYFENNSEVFDKFKKFKTNKFLINKYGGPGELLFDIYNIIYLIYTYYLDKSELKNEIFLVFSYFLCSKLKNMTYALYLCSKVKLQTHKLIYLKFLLIEDLVENFTSKLTKKAYIKDTLKNVEIGTVILYNTYIDKLKIKIYDAACNQIDYFEILRNNNTSKKATETFLKLGNTSLLLRTKIKNLWDKIIMLNPFSDEIEKDYMLYLETIIQDESLAQKEKKRYNMIKTSKLSEKNNKYYSLFIKEITSIILIDANNNNRIIFNTPNFPILFNYTQKEILNFTINDLIPPCITLFHKDLIEDGLKYSNLSHLFNKKAKGFFLKSKTNGIYQINLFIKCIPNLSYGLIYIGLVEKIKSNQFIILLDEEFKINSMSDPLSIVTNSSSIAIDSLSYGLNYNLIGRHIGLIIPEILKYLKYNGNKFTFIKSDIDLKSTLYSNTSNFEEDEKYINSILSQIKIFGQLNLEEINNLQSNMIKNLTNRNENNNIKDYKNLILNLKNKLSDSFYSIFYRIVSKTFLNGQYSYYIIYISNDILGQNNPEEKSIHEEEKEEEIIVINNCYTGIIDETSLTKVPQSILKKEKGITLNHYDEEKEIILEKDEKEKKEEKQNQEKELIMMNNINNIINRNNHHLHNKDLGNYNINDNDNINEPISQNSFMTRTSIDTISFNKLKSRILEKNESYHIKYLRILSFFFLLISILLIYLNTNSINSKFTKISIFINENYFFNHSKILISNIHIISMNLYLIKFGFIKDFDQKFMTKQLFSTVIDKLSKEIRKIAYFHNDYGKILSEIKYMNLYVYDMNTISKVALDGANLLSLILSHGIRLRANLDSYFNNEFNGMFDIYCSNIINCTYDYISNENIEGLDTYSKVKIAKSKIFKPIKSFLIVNFAIFVLIFSLFIWLVTKIYFIEKKFLKQLIMFRTNNFEIYLQYLDNVKKKLKKLVEDENGEEDIHHSNENNNNEKNDSNSLSPVSKYIKKKTNNTLNFEEELKMNNNEFNLKKRKGKIPRIHQQKKQKILKMTKYFALYNFFFCLKVCVIVFIVITNYLIIYILFSKKRDEFFELDNLMNDIIGVYKDNYLVYLEYKREIFLFCNFEIMKINYIKQLENGIKDKIIINGKNFSKNNINELKLTKYLFHIETLSKLKLKSFGNVIMDLISNKIGKQSLHQELKTLYNEDACEYLFQGNQMILDYCNNFWSSILKQGVEQSTIQFRLHLDNLLITLVQINENEVYEPDYSILYYIEIYITSFFLLFFESTIEIFDNIRNNYTDSLIWNFNGLCIFYSIMIFFLLIPLNIAIYYAKENFNSFLNFIGIIPVQYLSEDEKFYRDTLNLEGNIFY